MGEVGGRENWEGNYVSSGGREVGFSRVKPRVSSSLTLVIMAVACSSGRSNAAP